MPSTGDGVDCVLSPVTEGLLTLENVKIPHIGFRVTGYLGLPAGGVVQILQCGNREKPSGYDGAAWGEGEDHS